MQRRAAGIDATSAGRLFRDAILRNPGTAGSAGMINAGLFPRDGYYINNRLRARPPEPRALRRNRGPDALTS